MDDQPRETLQAAVGDDTLVPGSTVWTLPGADSTGQPGRGAQAGGKPADSGAWIADRESRKGKQSFGSTINAILYDLEANAREDLIPPRIRYNEMRGRPEKRMPDGSWGDWTDVDDLQVIAAYQDQGVRGRQNILDALAIFFKSHAVNPLRTLVEGLDWDGVRRCERFLTEIMAADDTDYTRECSRLIFATGIHRLYHPGCKADSVVVLIGAQGGGKSTICRWLALDDAYFRELDTIEGKEGVEVLQGCWIAEISEMLATTKAREVEAVKSYITRQTDAYREPYARRVTDIPRRCFFIGTSNNPQFLTDKTGNRRFFPVRTTITGPALFAMETDVRAYIAQCWAEARELMDSDEMKPVPKPELLGVIQERQAAAVEDDWRVGVIRHYLDTKQPGDTTCVREVWDQALYDKEQRSMTRKDSTEIGQIMRGFVDWTNTGKMARMGSYGPQRVWKKVAEVLSFPPGEMPFGQESRAQAPDGPPPKFIL